VGEEGCFLTGRYFVELLTVFLNLAGIFFEAGIFFSPCVERTDLEVHSTTSEHLFVVDMLHEAVPNNQSLHSQMAFLPLGSIHI